MNWGTGLVYLVALVGVWALGTRLTKERRAQLELILVAAACLNALLAWIRLASPPGDLFSNPGGAAGLMGNSTYFGALCAGGLWLLADRIGPRRRSLMWLAGVFLLAGGAQLSVERSAVALSALALFVPLRKAGLARAGAVGLAAMVGFGVAGALAASSTTGSSTARTFTREALSDARPEVWAVAASVAIQRPLFGVGPGRFGAAVGPHATARMSADNAYYTDGHNFVVTSAVTLGFVGTALMLGWLAVAAHRARGPLAGFAVVIGLMSLVQPQYPAITPLALLALGAASPPYETEGVALRGQWLVGAWCLGLAGVVVAALLLFGDTLMLRGLNRYSIADARRASSLLRPWPDPLLLQASIENHYDRKSSPGDLPRPIATARSAARRDPADPNPWVLLGSIERAAGQEAAAAEAFRRAILVFPFNAGALVHQAEIAQTLGDHRTRGSACRNLTALKIPTAACGP
jgi:hypothetical protein